MAFLFYIDGQLTDQPINEYDLNTSIKRESSLSVILINQDIEIKYANTTNPAAGTISGFTYLKSIYDNSICNEAELTIVNQTTPTASNTIFTGVIKVTNIKFDEQRLIISTKITDNNFYAYINNNKSVEVNLTSTRTKSNQQITPCPVYQGNLFSSCGFVYGAGVGAYFYGYRLSDVFRYVISFITDNKVGFYSKFLEDPNNGIHLFLYEGSNLTNENTQPDFSVTFDKLFRELFKARNVSFYIETANPDEPVLRLEDAEYFYSQTTIYSFDDIKEMTTTSKVDKLYGTVQVGSEILQFGANSANTFNEALSHFGWKKESYTPIGQCNLDNKLDLVNEYGISNNAVNQQIMGALTENLDAQFFIEMGSIDEVLLTATAKGYQTIYPSPTCILPFRFYNIGLNNTNKLQRHGTNYLNSVGNSQQIGGDGFRAELGTEVLLASTANSAVFFPQYTYYFAVGEGVLRKPVLFVDESTGSNYDTNNNYNPITGIYLVPTDGNYSFSALLNVEVSGAGQQCVGSVQVQPPLTLGVAVDGLGQTQLDQSLITHGVGIRVTIASYEDATLSTLLDFQEVSSATLQDGTYPVGCSFASALVAGNAVIVIVESFKARTITGNNANGTVSNTLNGSTPYLNSIMPIEWQFNSCAPVNPIEMYALENSYYTCNGDPDGSVVVASGIGDKFTINLFEFEYDISDSDWERIKATPIGLFNFTKDQITRSGYIESIVRNNQTGNSQVKLITSTDAIIS